MEIESTHNMEIIVVYLLSELGAIPNNLAAALFRYHSLPATKQMDARVPYRGSEAGHTDECSQKNVVEHVYTQKSIE